MSSALVTARCLFCDPGYLTNIIKVLKNILQKANCKAVKKLGTVVDKLCK